MSTPSQPHKYSTATTPRFKGPECEHANAHITVEAALKCAGLKPEDAKKLTKVSRYWGTTDGVRCACKFGHKTAESAKACVSPAPKKAKAPAKKAEPKPTASKAPHHPESGLHSVSTGQAARA